MEKKTLLHIYRLVLFVTPFPNSSSWKLSPQPTSLVYGSNGLRCYIPWVSIVQHRVGCPYWPGTIRLTPQELTKLLQNICKLSFLVICQTIHLKFKKPVDTNSWFKDIWKKNLLGRVIVFDKSPSPPMLKKIKKHQVGQTSCLMYFFWTFKSMVNLWPNQRKLS